MSCQGVFGLKLKRIRRGKLNRLQNDYTAKDAVYLRYIYEV